METSLIDRWLPAPDVLVLDAAAISIARERIRHIGAAFSTEIVETMALLTTELLTNQLRHASGGRFSASLLERDGVPGLEVVAADRGPGVGDPERALHGDRTPHVVARGGLGAGLSAVFRMADEVDADVRVGEGSCFRVRRFVTSPRHRVEVGIYARPCPGETVSGDDACVHASGTDLVVAVADGLGHGTPARDASSRAIDALASADREPLDEKLHRAERATAGTRGATIAVSRYDRGAAVLEYMAVGDVVARLDGGRKLAGQAGIIGLGRLRGPRSERIDAERGALLFVTSDGVASSGDAVRAAMRHPLLVAHDLVTHHGRDTDDALALVARLG